MKPFLSLVIASICYAQVPLPKATLVPTTATSYPFMSASHLLKPVDLAKAGYVEEEYILSGNANVYDWAEDGKLTVRTANAPYANRILIWRPATASKFSGTVVVELLNSARRFDWAMMGGYLADTILEHGHAYVGISPPAVAASLQKFDPTRYAALSFANPAMDAPCAGAGKGKGAQPIEEGLRWDMFSQAAAAMKSNVAGQPMGGFKVQAIYMTTQAGDITTYINAIHPNARMANGKPLYDGYLVKNPPAAGRINQCAAAPGAMQRALRDTDVPVIGLVAQGEAQAALANRRADSDKYRLYEIAGAAHIDGLAYSTMPAFPDEIAAAGTAQGSAEWPFNAMCDPPVPLLPQPLLKYAYNGALDALDKWVRKGVPAPKAPRLDVMDGKLVMDAAGHATGGIRSPYVDVPIATYHTVTPGPGTCAELFSVTPFDAARRAQLHGDQKSYVGKVNAATDRAVKAGFFTESDGKRMKAELTK